MGIGIYGGTFDPVHVGHVEAVRSVTSNFGLDLMLVIPAASPPHKDPHSVSGTHHRYAMAVLATLELSRVLVSTLEIDSPDAPYSYLTLEEIRGTYGPDASLFFLVGSDSFQQLHTWKKPDRILAQSNLVVVARPGYELDVETIAGNQVWRGGDYAVQDGKAVSVIDLRGKARFGGAPERNGNIYLTDYFSREVSSSDIRQRVRTAKSIEGLVPESVRAYIEKYELYKTRSAET